MAMGEPISVQLLLSILGKHSDYSLRTGLSRALKSNEKGDDVLLSYGSLALIVGGYLPTRPTKLAMLTYTADKTGNRFFEPTDTSHYK
jgi:hypothetical protein